MAILGLCLLGDIGGARDLRVEYWRFVREMIRKRLSERNGYVNFEICKNATRNRTKILQISTDFLRKLTKKFQKILEIN